MTETELNPIQETRLDESRKWTQEAAIKMAKPTITFICLKGFFKNGQRY